MKRVRKTAGELMAELHNDPRFVAHDRQREVDRLQRVERAHQVAAPVIAELASLGFNVTSIAELARTGLSYKKAVPALLKWLPVVSDPDVKEAIVRVLSVPFASSAAPLLIREFRKASEDEVALRWAIGNALAVLADDAVFDEVNSLVKDKRHGKAREMLALALGNMSDPRAVDVLVGLLDDEDVCGHAIIALGKLKARSARSAIEPFLEHPNGWIRKEARKALARIKIPDPH